MKVYLASRHLAKSTLDKKVDVYLRKSEMPFKKGTTKAQELRWVEKNIDVTEDVSENAHPLREEMRIRRFVEDSYVKEFNDFMEEHETRIGITREHLLQATYNDIADGEDGKGTPLQWLMRMTLAIADKAEGVLTINQQLSQERRELKTQLSNIDITNRELAKENDKLLLKLKELNERLVDQSKSREIYEKEAIALRERLTEKHQKRADNIVAEAAERIQENIKTAYGPVRLYSDDPAWKNWMMVIKACPKCGCSAAPFPERTVGCSQGCLAEDDVKSMQPGAWNEWAIDYVSEDDVPDKKKPEDYPNGVTLKIGAKAPKSQVVVDGTEVDMGRERTVPSLWDEDDTEVEVPPPDSEERPPTIYNRLTTIESQLDMLVTSNQVVLKVLHRLLEEQGEGSHDAIQKLQDNVVKEMQTARKLRNSNFGDSPAARVCDTVALWGVALQRVLEALRERQKNPDAAWIRIETALGDLL